MCASGLVFAFPFPFYSRTEKKNPRHEKKKSLILCCQVSLKPTRQALVWIYKQPHWALVSTVNKLIDMCKLSFLFNTFCFATPFVTRWSEQEKSMHCVCPNGTIKHRYLNVCFCKHKQPFFRNWSSSHFNYDARTVIDFKYLYFAI